MRLGTVLQAPFELAWGRQLGQAAGVTKPGDPGHPRDAHCSAESDRNPVELEV